MGVPDVPLFPSKEEEADEAASAATTVRPFLGVEYKEYALLFVSNRRGWCRSRTPDKRDGGIFHVDDDGLG
jgi:hypothetical protein